MKGTVTSIHAGLKPFSPEGAFEAFCLFRQAQGLRKATLNLDEAILRPFMRDYPELLEAPRPAVLAFLGAARKEWTRQTRIKVLKVFFRFLREEGITEEDPMRGIRGTTPPKITNLPALGDVKRFIDRLDPSRYAQRRLRAMLILALDSGLRRGELCALEKRDLDLSGHSVHIRGEVSKNHRDRYVPISPTTSREIHSFLLCHPAGWHSEKVFPSETGGPLRPGELGTQINRHSRQFGIPLHIHALRHLCATTFLRATGNLDLAARLLGHSNVRITSDFYTHLNNDDLRAAHAEASPVAAIMPAAHRVRSLKIKPARNESG